jgi:hypothetical protein
MCVSHLTIINNQYYLVTPGQVAKTRNQGRHSRDPLSQDNHGTHEQGAASVYVCVLMCKGAFLSLIIVPT